MGKYFGTDGIRGIAGEDLDAQIAFKIGRAVAAVLTKPMGKGQTAARPRPRVTIGRDTRISCDMLESALAAGLCSAGADVTLLGVLPTPAVAYMTVNSHADMGIVISASHNTFEYNGIKMFGTDGYKLSVGTEQRIEQFIDDSSGIYKATGGDIGSITPSHGVRTGEYVRYLASVSKGGRYSGRIAFDCANGAAAETVRLLFRQLHAEFEIIADEPDGLNINSECGSMHLNYLQDMIKTGRFSIGIAFDGDADRCLIVDEKGNIIDGDMMLAVFARDMKQIGTLKNDAFIGTVVSNAGMDIFARDNGLAFHRSDVGDWNVHKMMKELGCNLGGESSGHIIFSDLATTGDGQLTAVMFLNVLVASGKTASELVRNVPRLPQVMPSFKLTGGAEQRERILTHPRLAEEVKKLEALLSGYGRIHIRPSGTEAIIRVLVEAKTEKLSNVIAEQILELMGEL